MLGHVLELKSEDGHPDGHAVGAIGVEPVVIKDEDLMGGSFYHPGRGRR